MSSPHVLLDSIPDRAHATSLLSLELIENRLRMTNRNGLVLGRKTDERGIDKFLHRHAGVEVTAPTGLAVVQFSCGVRI
jgi:hypothetical protein